MNDLRVHLIDDDADVRDSLCFLLETSDIAVSAYDSAAAFLAVAAQAHGCIVTDIRMPEIDGITLLGRLRDQDIRLPTIVITGRSEERRVGKECKHWCRSRWSPYH